MKKILTILLSVIPFTIFAQSNFTVLGTVEGSESGTINLLKEGLVRTGTRGDTILSARIEDGKFTMTGEVPEAVVLEFVLEGHYGTVPFFPEAAEYTAIIRGIPQEGMLNEYISRISGGEKHEIYNQYREYANRFLGEVNAIQDEYGKALESGETKKVEETMVKYEGLLKGFFVWFDSFLADNQQTDVTAYILHSEVSDLLEEAGELGKRYSMLGPAAQNSPYGGAVLRMLEELSSRIKPDDIFPAIPLIRNGGPDFVVADINAKVKLIDFWSLGCSACLKEIGFLKELYAEYKDQGLEIIHIYTWTNSPDVWRSALARYDIPWISAFEKDAHKQPLKETLGVSYLPFKVLVDGENRVIAVNPPPHTISEILREKLR